MSVHQFEAMLHGECLPLHVFIVSSRWSVNAIYCCTAMTSISASSPYLSCSFCISLPIALHGQHFKYMFEAVLHHKPYLDEWLHCMSSLTLPKTYAFMSVAIATPSSCHRNLVFSYQPALVSLFYSTLLRLLLLLMIWTKQSQNPRKMPQHNPIWTFLVQKWLTSNNYLYP